MLMLHHQSSQKCFTLLLQISGVADRIKERMKHHHPPSSPIIIIKHNLEHVRTHGEKETKLKKQDNPDGMDV